MLLYRINYNYNSFFVLPSKVLPKKKGYYRAFWNNSELRQEGKTGAKKIQTWTRCCFFKSLSKKYRVSNGFKTAKI